MVQADAQRPSCHHFNLLNIYSISYCACPGVYSLSDKAWAWANLYMSTLPLLKEGIALEISPMFCFPVSSNKSFSPPRLCLGCVYFGFALTKIWTKQLVLPVTTEASERRQGVNLEMTLYSESQQSRRPEYYHSQICLTQTMPTSPFYWGQEQRQLITPNVSLVPPVRWSSLIFVIRGVDTFLLISSCTFSLSSSSLSLCSGGFPKA